MRNWKLSPVEETPKDPFVPIQGLLAIARNFSAQQDLSGADLDAAVAMAKEAGFDVSKADWLKYQAKQTLELSDEELEGVAGGYKRTITDWDCQI